MRIVHGFIAALCTLAVAACGSADGDNANTQIAADQVEQELVGRACSPTSSGPLPMCGATAEYCNAGSACGSTGVCAARPQGCPTVVARVCGCNGKTYPNACEAARAGVSVHSSGSCPPVIQ